MSDASARNFAFDPEDDRDPVEQLAEEFLQRRRRGETVSVSDYAGRYPEHSTRIRDLFPTLLLVEQCKPDAAVRGVHPLADPVGETPLERLGDFRIVRELGRGGMGVVYEAEQESLGRRVALKVLPAAYVEARGRLQRFLREAQAAARLHHTNIIPVFGVGQQEGLRYYVMQLIPGQGLDRIIAALAAYGLAACSGPKDSLLPTAEYRRDDGEASAPAVEPDDKSPATLSVTEAARMLLVGPPSPGSQSADSSGWGRASDVSLAPSPGPSAAAPAWSGYWRSVARVGVQVADALQYAHRQGTLHRDVKPSNLLLDNRGIVWVADFGLAKLVDVDDLTQTGDVVGTLRYMAPEQFEGKCDARSDVYSLGLTLYELLTLRPAFAEKDRRRLIRQVMHDEPVRPRKLNPAIPRDLETILVKSIACDPVHRYQSAGALAADLQCFLEDRPIRRGGSVRPSGSGDGAGGNPGDRRAGGHGPGSAVDRGGGRLGRVLPHHRRVESRLEAARRQAEAENQRAEANLRLAVKALEDVFAKVTDDRLIASAEEGDDDDEIWPEPRLDVVITPKEAALLESVLKFYDQFAEANQNNVGLQRETARAYRRVGDVHRRLGQNAKAETAYHHALELYQKLPATGGEAGDSTAANPLTLATLHNDLGIICRATGRFAEAKAAHGKALELLDPLAAGKDASADARFELARNSTAISAHCSHGPWRWVPAPGRGITPRGFRRWREAAEHNRKALEIFDALCKESPENATYRLVAAGAQRQRYLIASVNRQADDARAAKQQAVDILEKLAAAAPDNLDYRYELAETHLTTMPRGRFGIGGLRGGDSAAAVKEATQAVDLAGQLVERCPAVPEYRALLARAHDRCGHLLQSDAPDEAQKHLVKAVEMQKALSAEFTGVEAYRMMTARSLSELAQLQTSRHQWPEAKTIWEAAIAATKQIEAADPQTRFVRPAMAMQYRALARVLRELGDERGAKDAAAKGGDVGGHHGWWPGGPFREERRSPRHD